MFHPCPKRLIYCDEIRAVHIPVFRYLEAHVVGAGQIARVVGLGSHVFINACAIALRTNTTVLSAAAELEIAEQKKFGLIHSRARLRHALKTLRKRACKLTQRIA